MAYLIGMILGNGEGCALHQIGGINRCRTGRNAGQDQSQILLAVVLADTAMDAIGGKSLCGANAAFNILYHNTSPFTGHAPIAMFIFSMAAPDAPLPRLQNNA